MTRILALSGSLRTGSFNTALARAAKAQAPAGVTVEVATLHGIPLYDGDVEEAEGIPVSVEALKSAIREADGVLLVTPEYNNGIPGVFKNAIDWASRPPKDSAALFRGRPFALIGASPGGFGTILSQNGWLPVLRIQWRLRDLAAAAVSTGTPLPAEYHRLFRVWFVPLFLCFPPAFVLNRLGQHYDIDPTHPLKWSTVMAPSRLWDFLFVYSNYHAEHHYFQSVPFYNLRKLHLRLRPLYAELGIKPHTYREIVWDWFVKNRAPHSDWGLAGAAEKPVAAHTTA